MQKTLNKQFLLTLNYVKDFYYKRIPYHQSHIEYYTKANQKGDLVIVGGTEFPAESGILFVAAPSKEQVESLVLGDPFFKQKLINGYLIEEVEDRTQASIEEVSKYYTYICK